MSETLEVGTVASVQIVPQQVLQERTELDFQFTGSAGEYFRIWIVNIFLSIITLGIYSAWAKVRNKQYFYRHTWLDGASFDYLGDPIRILKGRLIAAAALGLLALSQYVSMTLYFVGFFLLLFAMPWVMVKALSFNARNSAWRNVRFSFSGRAMQAAIEYLKGLFVTTITLGVLSSWMQWNFTRFVVQHFSFGKLPFHFRARSSDYFFVYLRFFLFVLGISLVAFFILVTGGAFGSSEDGGTSTGGSVAVSIASIGIYLFFFGAMLYLRVRITNLMWGNIAIGSHEMKANQRFREVLELQLTNAFAIACSLGLAIPWAKVRSHRYFLEHLAIQPSGPLLVEADEAAGSVSAVGEGFGDLGDIGFDFG